MTNNFFKYIRLLRVHQYLKNLFIFLPIFFAGKIMETDHLLAVTLAFVAFSLSASAIYIINDIADIKSDQKHPVKKLRPIAAGEVNKSSALIIAAFMAVAGISLGAYLGQQALISLVAYLIINIFYSLRLKHIAIIDVMCIALFFIIRINIGAKVASVDLSMWIVVITFLLALFLALTKRRDDLVIFISSGESPRKSLEGYNIEMLNASLVIMSAVIIVSYIMYTISTEVVQRVDTNNLYITAVFVIMGIMRYLQIAFVFNDAGSPTMVLIKDRFIQLTIIGWLLTFGYFLYV